MDVFEVDKTETVGRTEAAAQLRRIADQLAGDDETIGFDRNGMQFSLPVPDEVQLKVELEISADEREVELQIELRW